MRAKIYVKKQNINIWELQRLLLAARLEWILGVTFWPWERTERNKE